MALFLFQKDTLTDAGVTRGPAMITFAAPGETFCLTAEQARELAEALQATADHLEATTDHEQ